ncbi:MAG: HAD-IIA family hydrolase [Promethearchaeota archaeon]
MSKLIEDLKHIKLAIFDLDGVVYRGQKLITNVDKVIKELKDLSIRVIYNSNNSTATKQMYVERLRNFGILSEKNDFYTSASITATEITKIKKDSNIYVIGEKGLREELKFMGHNIIINPKSFDDIDFVIVGLDREFTYKKLAFAQKCVLEGHAQFYATNTDSTLPAASGILPGAGTMVNALETCTGKKPIKIFGKPEPIGINLILKDIKIPAKNACIFGDRLNTDIVAGNRAGIMTIAVLTGVTSEDMINDLKHSLKESELIDTHLVPDLVIKSLNEIFEKKFR